FVVAASHPLLSVKEDLLLQAMSTYPAILPDAKFTTGQVVRELFAERQLPLTVDEGMSTDYLETLKALVSIGNAWSVLPHTMLDTPGLKVLKPAGVSLSRELVCVR